MDDDEAPETARRSWTSRILPHAALAVFLVAAGGVGLKMFLPGILGGGAETAPAPPVARHSGGDMRRGEAPPIDLGVPRGPVSDAQEGAGGRSVPAPRVPAALGPAETLSPFPEPPTDIPPSVRKEIDNLTSRVGLVEQRVETLDGKFGEQAGVLADILDRLNKFAVKAVGPLTGKTVAEPPRQRAKAQVQAAPAPHQDKQAGRHPAPDGTIQRRDDKAPGHPSGVTVRPDVRVIGAIPGRAWIVTGAGVAHEEVRVGSRIAGWGAVIDIRNEAGGNAWRIVTEGGVIRS